MTEVKIGDYVQALAAYPRVPDEIVCGIYECDFMGDPFVRSDSTRKDLQGFRAVKGILTKRLNESEPEGLSEIEDSPGEPSVKPGDWVKGQAMFPLYAEELIEGEYIFDGSYEYVRTEAGQNRAVEGAILWPRPSQDVPVEPPADLDDTVQGTVRGDVLEEARALIEGDRNKTYGSPTQNFSNTAEVWTALLRHKLRDGERITATEVGTLMVGLKLARTVAQPKRDNFVDMAGYAACAAECMLETIESE